MKKAVAFEDRPGMGILFMSLGILMFTGIDTSAKWLVLAGMWPLQVVFARYLFHFVAAFVWFAPREGLDALRSTNPKLQLLRSALLLGSTVFNFYAMQYLPLPTIVAIYFSGPIITSLLAVPLLGERVGVHRMIAIVIGFCGVLVVVQPWGAEFRPAMILPLAGISCASGYFILTRKMAGTEANSTAQLWPSALGALLVAPLVFPQWQWPEPGLQTVIFVAVGVFGFTGHALVTHAHRLAPASTLAPVSYEQIFYASIASWLVFGVLPTQWTVVGALIICASGLYIWSRERAGKARIKSPRPDI